MRNLLTLQQAVSVVSRGFERLRSRVFCENIITDVAVVFARNWKLFLILNPHAQPVSCKLP